MNSLTRNNDPNSRKPVLAQESGKIRHQRKKRALFYSQSCLFHLTKIRLTPTCPYNNKSPASSLLTKLLPIIQSPNKRMSAQEASIHLVQVSDSWTRTKLGSINFVQSSLPNMWLKCYSKYESRQYEIFIIPPKWETLLYSASPFSIKTTTPCIIYKWDPPQLAYCNL